MRFDMKKLRYILDSMKTIVQFNIKKDGTTYIAEGVDLAIVTEAQNLDDLVKNIEEAVSLYFENENSADFDYSKKPSILVNYELPQHA